MSATETLSPVKLTFSPTVKTSILDEWLSQIYELADIIGYVGTIDDDIIAEFFNHFYNSLNGLDSYLHFQLLNDAIPQFIENHISEQNLLLSSSHLRNIFAKALISNPDELTAKPAQMEFLLNRFDDLDNFIKQNFTLHLQLVEKPATIFNEILPQMPVQVISINGPRFLGKTVGNAEFFQFFNIDNTTSLQYEFWQQVIARNEFEGLRQKFINFYENAETKYIVTYRCNNIKGHIYEVFERGVIRYNQSGEPELINAILIPAPVKAETTADDPLKTTLNGIGEAIKMVRTPACICDQSGSIQFSNDAFAKLFNASPAKIKNYNFADFLKSEYQIDYTQMISMPESGQLDAGICIGTDSPQTFDLATREIKFLDNQNLFWIELLPRVIHAPVKTKIHKQNDQLNLFSNIQRELLLKKNIQDIYSNILDYALQLVPKAKAGSLLRFEQDGLSFIAAQGYDLTKLKKLKLFKGHVDTYRNNSTQLQLMSNGSYVKKIENILNEAEQFFGPREFAYLKKHGRLDEIHSTLTAVLKIGKRTHGLINLDIMDSGKEFSSNDIEIIDHLVQHTSIVLERIDLIHKIHNSEKNYKSLFWNSPIPAFILIDDKIQLHNEKFDQLFKYSADEIKKMSFWNLIAEPEVKQLKIDIISGLRNSKNGIEFKFTTVDKNETEIFCLGYFSMIKFAGENAILGMISDLTENKSLEKQLIQSQKLETIGTLTAGIAHDFNNILGAISPTAEMIMLDPQNPASRERAETIYNMADRANKLSKQLLSFSRVDKTQISVFDLNHLVSNSRNLIEKSIGVKIKLNLDLHPELKSIEGDANQFVQIIMNLVINAKDAMNGEGEITIRTKNIYADANYSSVDSSFEEGEYVYLSVADNGPGIPEDIRTKIFDPFFTTKEEGKGTGLGLNMVYGITKSHKGIVILDTKLNHGSTFNFYFPATELEVTRQKKNPHPEVVTGSGTIMAVDDESGICDTYQALLQILGYEPIIASSGQQAIEIYRGRHQEIDLVLLDYMMPQMDGRETFRKLKEINGDVQVIICSGYSEQDGLSELIKSGIEGTLAKPFTIQSISQKLKEVFKKK